MQSEFVETDRLWLIPLPLDVVKAACEGRRSESGFPYTIPEAWPDSDLRDFLPTYAAMLAEEPGTARWGVWVMIEQASRTVIGDIGFKGAPDGEGRIEIGYSVLPLWRQQGFATEAARAMIDWGLKQPAVKAVLAECLATNEPSARVLRSAGLQQTSTDGELLKWMVAR